MKSPYNRSELAVVIVLRVIGFGGLLAIPAIFIPFAWVSACHEFVGLGQMPNGPIVPYLARSLSAFYTLVGAVLLYLSLDIRRYRSFIRVWSVIIITMGLILLGIDWSAGLPIVWTVIEGPVTSTVGLILFWLQAHIAQD